MGVPKPLFIRKGNIRNIFPVLACITRKLEMEPKEYIHDSQVIFMSIVYYIAMTCSEFW